VTVPAASVPAAPGSAPPELAFSVLGAARVPYAAVPTLAFSLQVESLGGGPIRSVLLDVQIQIGARRRAYDEREQEALFELFGATRDWGSTLRTLLWTRTTRVVPPFTASTVVDLPVVCSYDLEVAGSRYFDALHDGEVPLEFLFSGAVFYSGPGGALQTVRISWEQEAAYRLPVAVWRETIDGHFPGTAWLRLRRDSFEALRAYKARHALATWEDALDGLLGQAEER
jgi:uncharacterized protein DUF6084